MGLPVSSVSSRDNSGFRSRMISAARRRMRARSTGFIAAQSPCARAALAIAFSTTSGVASWTTAITSPVAG